MQKGKNMDIGKFSQSLYDSLGQAGAEAVLDAIVFYLNESKEFACEEDKLVLLNILFQNCDYVCSYKAEFNPLFHFSITFDKNRSESIG